MKRRGWLLAALSLPAAPVVAQSYEQFFRALDVDNAARIGELLARGFDPNTPNEQGHLPLYLALRGGNLRAAEVLVEHRETRIDALNAHGETALMMAALKGRVDWMERLLARGARVDKAGWTPLHYAASGPEPRTVALLLDKGAALDPLSPTGLSPLMMAALYGNPESALLLAQRGADRALRNRGGESAADIARRVGRAELAERLAAVPGR